MDDGAPSSYLALDRGTAVTTNDGVEIGRVARVLADEDDDLYDGLIVTTDDGDRFVDAEHAAQIYERGVVLSLSAAEARHLPEPSPHPPEMSVHPDDTVERDPAAQAGEKIRRAWELISGKY